MGRILAQATQETPMTSFEMVYLAGAVAAFVVFAIVLLYADGQSKQVRATRS